MCSMGGKGVAQHQDTVGVDGLCPIEFVLESGVRNYKNIGWGGAAELDPEIGHDDPEVLMHALAHAFGTHALHDRAPAHAQALAERIRGAIIEGGTLFIGEVGIEALPVPTEPQNQCVLQGAGEAEIIDGIANAEFLFQVFRYGTFARTGNTGNRYESRTTFCDHAY